MGLAAQEGLDILIQDKNVLSCWSDRWDAIWYAELGSSWAVLNAGFNIDCMISRSTALPASAIVWHLCWSTSGVQQCKHLARASGTCRCRNCCGMQEVSVCLVGCHLSRLASLHSLDATSLFLSGPYIKTYFTIPPACPVVAVFCARLPGTDQARGLSKLASACLLLVAKACDGLHGHSLFCIQPLHHWTEFRAGFLSMPPSSDADSTSLHLTLARCCTSKAGT